MNLFTKILEKLKQSHQLGDSKSFLEATLELSNEGYFIPELSIKTLVHYLTLANENTPLNIEPFVRTIDSATRTGGEDSSVRFARALIELTNTSYPTNFLMKLAEVKKYLCEESVKSIALQLELESYRAYFSWRPDEGKKIYNLRPLFPVPIPDQNPKAKVSFIIPVLDLSPYTPDHNIITLLSSLSNIAGEVIVVFNDMHLGQKLSNHPRINRFAVLSENIGVSRAWATGIALTRTEYAIILNSDVLVFPGLAESLCAPMVLDPQVAMTGPVGYSENPNLPNLLSAQSWNEPTVVRELQGAIFCVRSSRLLKNQRKDAYTLHGWRIVV